MRFHKIDALTDGRYAEFQRKEALAEHRETFAEREAKRLLEAPGELADAFGCPRNDHHQAALWTMIAGLARTSVREPNFARQAEAIALLARKVAEQEAERAALVCVK